MALLSTDKIHFNAWPSMSLSNQHILNSTTRRTRWVSKVELAAYHSYIIAWNKKHSQITNSVSWFKKKLWYEAKKMSSLVMERSGDFAIEKCEVIKFLWSIWSSNQTNRMKKVFGHPYKKHRPWTTETIIWFLFRVPVWPKIPWHSQNRSSYSRHWFVELL